jgi:prepilin peptidase CpaA
MEISALVSSAAAHWEFWLVSVVLIVAAVIDGKALKVPNWITFPFIIAGWMYSLAFHGWDGLGYSLVGTVIGLGLLLPLYAIGGMGAGDVKLLAGVGAWISWTDVTGAFCWSAIVGAIMAVAMVLARNAWTKHSNQFWMIFNEIVTIRNPDVLAGIAAERKSRMLLLPYGIPICIGTILYFAWMGKLV